MSRTVGLNSTTFVPNPIENEPAEINPSTKEVQLSAQLSRKKNESKKFKYDEDCFQPSKSSSYYEGSSIMAGYNKKTNDKKTKKNKN